MSQTINLKIGGKSYSVEAKTPELERLMRIAAETINKQIVDYDRYYPNTSPIDKLSFIALNDTVMRLKMQQDYGKLEKEHEKLHLALEDYLENIDKNSR